MISGFEVSALKTVSFQFFSNDALGITNFSTVRSDQVANERGGNVIHAFANGEFAEALVRQLANLSQAPGLASKLLA